MERHIESEEMATLTAAGRVPPDPHPGLAAYGYKQLHGAEHVSMLCPCLTHEGQGCYTLLQAETEAVQR